MRIDIEFSLSFSVNILKDFCFSKIKSAVSPIAMVIWEINKIGFKYIVVICANNFKHRMIIILLFLEFRYYAFLIFKFLLYLIVVELKLCIYLSLSNFSSWKLDKLLKYFVLKTFFSWLFVIKIFEFPVHKKYQRKFNVNCTFNAVGIKGLWRW